MVVSRPYSLATSTAATIASPHDPPPGPRGGAAGHQERVPVGDGHIAVDHRAVEGLGPEVLPHPLEQVGVDVVGGVDRALGVGPEDHQPGLALLEVAAGPADGAAGADPGHE